MGKLYDRKDMEFELGLIDQLEQELSTKIAQGRISPLALDSPIEEFDDDGKLRKVYTVRDSFELHRQRARMKLLRSGSLMRDLRYALGWFNRCPACTERDGRRIWCKAHQHFKKTLSAVYWAAKENFPIRMAQGRPEDGEDYAHDGSCNAWEQWYLNDVRDKIWPGQTVEERENNRKEYGGTDYRAWLGMLLENEEIEFPAYQSELNRLRMGAD